MNELLDSWDGMLDQGRRKWRRISRKIESCPSFLLTCTILQICSGEALSIKRIKIDLSYNFFGIELLLTDHPNLRIRPVKLMRDMVRPSIPPRPHATNGTSSLHCRARLESNSLISFFLSPQTAT